MRGEDRGALSVALLDQPAPRALRVHARISVASSAVAFGLTLFELCVHDASSDWREQLGPPSDGSFSTIITRYNGTNDVWSASASHRIGF